jgi:two-component system, NtrC family, sensor histidine kinase AtoS
MTTRRTSKRPAAAGLSEVLDTFHATFSNLDQSYDGLKKEVEALNVQLAEKNLQLASQFDEVNRLRHFLDSILNSMHEAVVVVDTEGRIVLFNGGAERLTGYSRDEVLTKPYREVFGGRSSPRFSPLHSLEVGVSLTLEEKEIPTRTGGRVSVRYSASRVTDESNRILGAVEVMNDLFHVKRIEDELQRIKTQAALNQMADLVAHETRNPLGGVRGYADLLAETFEPGDSRIEMIDLVRQAVTRLDETVNRFQCFAQPVKPHFEETDLTAFVQDVVDFFRRGHGASSDVSEIAVVRPETPLPYRVDPILIQQAMTAILDNAVKAIETQGAVQVELLDTDLAGRRAALIRITDTGCGMTPETVEKLFTPFFTTRNIGLGLGLAVAKNFISFHQGQIAVKSAPGQGSTFTIVLPKL